MEFKKEEESFSFSGFFFFFFACCLLCCFCDCYADKIQAENFILFFTAFSLIFVKRKGVTGEKNVGPNYQWEV